MPSNWSMVESNFPTFTGEEPVRMQIGKLVDYMLVLTDQLKYNLVNLDTTNWNETAMTEFQQNTTQNVEQDVEDLDGTVEETNGNLALVKLAVEDLAAALLDLQEKMNQWEEVEFPKLNEALTDQQEKMDQWEEVEFPKLNETLTDLGKDMEQQKKVIVPDGSGGATIGTEGQVLRLVGTVYINGVLVE